MVTHTVLARIFVYLAIGKNLLVELINDIPGVGVIEKDFLGRDLPKKNPDAPNSKATKTLQSVNPHSLFRKWELKISAAQMSQNSPKPH